jgi:hypothetical protein
MKFMIGWKIPPTYHTAAAKGFLSSGAPMPEGLKQLGRWHGPGSVKGWALVECEDPSALHQHIAVWADRLECEVTPVVEDSDAAESLIKVFKG